MSLRPLPLQIETDPASGQLRRVHDPKLDLTILSFLPGEELLINGLAPRVSAVKAEGGGGEHLLVAEGELKQGYLAGQRLRLRRHLTLGGVGLHLGRSQSLHLRWQVQRLPWGDRVNGMDEIWGAPLEAPLTINTLTVLGAPAQWFGPATRMRAVAIGGSGPREHVSYEDGPVAEVVPWLNTGFRATFPGQMTVPGALYYHPEDERWVWVLVRRPQVGGRIHFAPDRQAFEFTYFSAIKVHDELLTPEISIHWGRGLAEAERVMAEQFDRYEEPPVWWYHTAWFWLHPFWQPNGSFRHAEEAVRILMGECGVSGFGLAAHDLPLSGRDIDVRSLAPAPTLGGEDGLRRLTDLIRGQGGHSFVWQTRTGLYPGGDLRDEWVIRGEDGRRLGIQPGVEHGVKLNLLNNDDAGCREHLLGMIRRYVTELGVTGIFWDSGAQPMPPDFTPRPGLGSPGQSMTAPLRFYEDAYRLGRSLSPDFFMWFEGISTELRSNAFAVDNRSHGPNSGHALMHRLAHLGGRRLVWRSAWPHEVAGAFPFVSPPSDIGQDPGPAIYRKIAADPMNRWLCRTLKQRGCRQAVGLADGIARLDEFVIVCPGQSGTITLPAADCPAGTLVHGFTGARSRGERHGERLHFVLPTAGYWEIE